MSVKLAYAYFGEEGKTPLVILHGLLGSSRNWTTVAKELSRSFDVFAVDLRNHGHSPWDDDCSFSAMAQDVRDFLAEHEIERPILMGHSLGGKVAMRLLADEVKIARALVCVDIAPKDYPNRLRSEFEAMAGLDLSTITSRADAANALEEAVPDWAHRQFLLTNLERDEANEGFRWSVNLEALHAQLADLMESPFGAWEAVPEQTLFLRGEHSDFILDEDCEQMSRHFPRYLLKTIRDAGHNVHVENKRDFIAAVERFGMDFKN